MSEFDKKISALTGGSASQASDEYVIARGGSNFKITGANVAAAATAVGTLTALTVTGDLTVDTSTLKVDAANNRVGIGTASPATQLHIETNSTTVSSNVRVVGGSSDTSTTGGAGGASITLKNLNTTNNTYNGIYGADAGDNVTTGIVFQNNSDANNEGTIAFLTRPTSGSVTERARITSGGELLTGGKTTATANGGDVQVSSGITFPATQVAKSDANTLDDYEEGTWTPTCFFGGSSVAFTFSEQAGKYTKVGRQVTIEAEIVLTAKGSGSGQLTIRNLPFSSMVSEFTGAIELRNVTFATKYAIVELGRFAADTCRVMLIDTAATSAALSDSGVANNSVFLFSLTYFV